MDRSSLAWLLEHAASVVAVLVAVVGRIAFWKELLDFVVVDSGANRKFQILLSDRVPELVNHHDGQEVTNSREEQPVHVVLDTFADWCAQDVENDLTHNEHENSEKYVSQWPSLLQCADNEEELHDEENREKDGAEDVDHNDHADRVLRTETTDVFEGQNADCEADQKQDKGADSKKPDGKCRAIFVKLKADKSTDHERDASR